MGAVPSKVGSSPVNVDLPARAHSSMSIHNTGRQEFTPLWRPPTSSGFRKLYRKNSQCDFRNAFWFGSTGVLNHQEVNDCRRCDALFNLCCDKDIIVGSLEGLVAEMRVKLAAYDNQLKEAWSVAHIKRHDLALKLFEAKKRISYLEELCSTNKISHDAVNNHSSTSKASSSSVVTDDFDNEDTDFEDYDDDGLKRHGNKMPSKTFRRQYHHRPSTAVNAAEKTPSYGAHQTKSTPQRSVSGVQYRRRPSTAASGALGSQNWAVAGGDSLASDSISAHESPRNRYEPRRSATISAGTFSAMTGQTRRRP